MIGEPDAMIVAPKAAASGDSPRNSRAHHPSGFAGVDGIFRLRTDGLIQRGLAVLEVHRSATPSEFA